MDMPIHNEIERSSNHIQEEIYDNESDYDNNDDIAGEVPPGTRPNYGFSMIFDVLQDP